MKALITTLSIIVCLGMNAQTVAFTNNAPAGMLFRGMDNVIQVTDDLNQNGAFQLEFTGGEIQVFQEISADNPKGIYILQVTNSEKNPELIVKDKDGLELNRIQYKTSRIPENTLQFATKDGQFSLKEPRMVLKNGAFAYFEFLEEISSWEVEYNGNVIASGNGNTLSEEAMQRLMELPIGTEFSVNAVCMNDKGISRKRLFTSTVN